MSENEPKMQEPEEVTDSTELDEETLDDVAGGGLSTIANAGGSGSLSAAFPDVCKTPTPGGPVPIPYPNLGEDTQAGTKGTKLSSRFPKKPI